MCHQDLSSNFALKIHALLCRTYLKGRDWYDFSWYVTQKIPPNLPHLQAALYQYGPWAGQSITVDKDWLSNVILKKVAAVDWQDAVADVERFLNTMERQSLKLWNERFFRNKLENLIQKT